MSYDKGSVVILYLVQDGAEEKLEASLYMTAQKYTLLVSVCKNGQWEHYVLAFCHR